MSRILTICLVLGVMIATSSVVGALMPTPSLNDLVHKADKIVSGKITIRETVKETLIINPKGEAAELVFTYLEITPDNFLKGEELSKIVVRIIGGYIDGYAIIDEDAPVIRDGEDAVLFLATSKRLKPDAKPYIMCLMRNMVKCV